jgi:hypothetical protein
LKLDPIGNNDLAREAEVSQSTASTFFKDKFKGHTNYRALCRDAVQLGAALKLLNCEYTPHFLFERCPASESDGGEE